MLCILDLKPRFNRFNKDMLYNCISLIEHE
jgi:hypothetical protein